MIRQALSQSTRSLQPCSFRAGSRRPLPRTHNFAASSQRQSELAAATAPWRASARAFSSSPRWLYAEAEEQKEGSSKKEQKSKKQSSEDRGGQAGKSPFSVFVDVLREELQKSREMNENIRQLQGETTKAMDSEAMKKMKAAYEKARVSSQLAIYDHAFPKRTLADIHPILLPCSSQHLLRRTLVCELLLKRCKSREAMSAMRSQRPSVG